MAVAWACASSRFATGTVTRTSAVSVRFRRMASAITQNLALYSSATTRSRDWYQYRTMSRSLPKATTYRFTEMGEPLPTSMGISPEDIFTHPAPGRQFLGEWGALPVRWVRKAATNRPAEPCPDFAQSGDAELQ